MQVTGFPTGPLAANCWVVGAEDRAERGLRSGAGSDCVVIDPGMEVEAPLRGLLAEQDLHPVAVLLTHGHFDHAQGAAALGVPVYLHPADRPQLTDPWTPVGLPVGTAGITPSEPDDIREIEGGAGWDGSAPLPTLQLAGLDVTVHHAPGHTPGSLVYAIEDHLFTGDVLFAGTIGRTDFPGGDGEQMTASLAHLVASFGDDVEVHPGHGESTTIGQERQRNPYLVRL